jgi:hypothetical protein
MDKHEKNKIIIMKTLKERAQENDLVTFSSLTIL